MPRNAARVRASQAGPGLYQTITDKIIAELQASRVPSVQPRRTAATNALLAMPKNGSGLADWEGS